MVISTVLTRIPIDTICITALRRSWRTQARCAPEAMKDLVSCVSAHRWLQSVTVRGLGGDRYELLDGERRLIAARTACETHIDAVVVDANDATAATICLLANMGGKKLRPIEKALACAQVREALASSGATATQEAVGKWVGLRQPTVHQYLQIADSFDAATLSRAGLTADDLGPYPAKLLEQVAGLEAEERTAWLDGVREGDKTSEPRSAAVVGSNQVARHVRQLKETCLRQPAVSSPAEATAVLVELLGVVRMVAAHAVVCGLAHATGTIRHKLESSNYRSPIIRMVDWVRLLRSLLLRGAASLRCTATRVAARAQRWLLVGWFLASLSVGIAQTCGDGFSTRGNTIRPPESPPPVAEFHTANSIARKSSRDSPAATAVLSVTISSRLRSGHHPP